MADFLSGFLRIEIFCVRFRGVMRRLFTGRGVKDR
jgi:hypothetical protein